MRIKRTCKICGDEFSAIKTTQFFCSRKCFKRDYYLRTKSKIVDTQLNPTYPIKKCSFCFESARLNFDPMRTPELFNAWGCPHCGATNQLIWEHQNNPNSYQIISKLLISMQLTAPITQQAEIQYQKYQIPIQRLEQGNPSVVVLTCETLNILDIQKKNRKKIVFS